MATPADQTDSTNKAEKVHKRRAAGTEKENLVSSGPRSRSGATAPPGASAPDITRPLRQITRDTGGKDYLPGSRGLGSSPTTHAHLRLHHKKHTTAAASPSAPPLPPSNTRRVTCNAHAPPTYPIRTTGPGVIVDEIRVGAATPTGSHCRGSHATERRAGVAAGRGLRPTGKLGRDCTRQRTRAGAE